MSLWRWVAARQLEWGGVGRERDIVGVGGGMWKRVSLGDSGLRCVWCECVTEKMDDVIWRVWIEGSVPGVE